MVNVTKQQGVIWGIFGAPDLKFSVFESEAVLFIHLCLRECVLASAALVLSDLQPPEIQASRTPSLPNLPGSRWLQFQLFVCMKINR